VEQFRQLSRRNWFGRSVAIGVSCYSVAPAAFAQSEDPNDEFRDFAGSELPDLRPLGTKPALPDEISKADALLLASPRNDDPINVLLYLESLRDRNVDSELYNAGWRTRWNPLIVRLFTETKTTPSGDATPWCAACLNWTLARSGLRTTQSASSGSFRRLTPGTKSPLKGDIVVFARTDPDESGVGRGHVGLFLEEDEDSVLVLGGNQKTKAGHHAVCRQRIRKKGATLMLHSYHSISSLR